MTNPICKLRCSEKERWKRVDFFFLIYEQFSENVDEHTIFFSSNFKKVYIP